MELKALKALTAAGLLAATTAASAGTAPFSMVSGVTNPGVDVTLTIQQSTVPGYDYDFVVTNSSLMGIVTGVYFEIDWDNMLSSSGMSSGPASLVSSALDPQILDWTDSKESHTVNQYISRQWVGRGYKDFIYDDINDGIKEGQQQVFSFMSDVLSVTDLGNMLGTDGYGVAIKMQGLTEDEQAAGWGEADQREEELLLVQANSFVQLIEPVDNDGGSKESNVVSAPSPTAALAGVALAGIAGLRRRRK